ncbi:MAG: hypothetical protein ACNYPG_04345 [Candidatus Porifericomitaceae bacterium WSBS_2022_MAG_OTU9]
MLYLVLMFNYYQNLSPALKAVYRVSDRVESIPAIANIERLCSLSLALREDLASGNRTAVGDRVQVLAGGLAHSFTVGVPKVVVLNKRPVHNQSEYHGLYELPEDGSQPVIKVWMYTSQRRRIVAYKTFLRTFLHEFCHHLDYQWLRLPDSLHTEGFFKRESNLFKQLLPVEGA